MTWQPRPEAVAILASGLRHVQSVPYDVSARWLFYRLLQEGIYTTKEDYHGRFLPLTAKARKNFYGGWTPETLADDTRAIIEAGGGYDSPTDWLRAILNYERYNAAKWTNQDYYIECWFEAKAMRGQFEYYTRHIPLLPFGGDISIRPKWDTAKRLEEMWYRYEKPVVILYFGDDDPKGQLIPLSALADIEAWCAIPFEYKRVGLMPGQGEELGIAENPEKPGCYQWEALDDAQAGDIIQDAIGGYWNADGLEATEADEQAETEKFHGRFGKFVDDYNDEEDEDND